jgi:hypothetical protein
VHAPTAAEQAQARAAFAVLTDSQRALLRRLQSTRDDLAAARLQVVLLANQVETAQTRLADAERAAQKADDDIAKASTDLDQLLGQVTELATAIYQHLNDGVVLDTVNTAAKSEMNRVDVYSQAPQDRLDLLVAQASATKRELAGARERAKASRATAVRASRCSRRWPTRTSVPMTSPPPSQWRRRAKMTPPPCTARSGCPLTRRSDRRMGSGSIR